MKIGIDIDDTLTEIKDLLTKSATAYAKSLGKDVSSENINITDIYNRR